jgi:hypothetical protein
VLPEDLFIIATKDAGPIVKWNMNLGRIASSGALFAEQEPETYLSERDEWLPWIPNPEYRTFVGFHTLRVTSDIRVEYNAELARLRGHRGNPSRLACLFAWGSLDDATLAKSKMSGRFKGNILRCRPVLVLRATRCNSALVSFAKRAESAGFMTDQDAIEAIWSRYWSGSGEAIAIERQNLLGGPPEKIEMSPEPLWEWLVDGALDIIETADD